MNRHGIMGMVVLALLTGNVGCYYDQWVQAKRSNGVLREELAGVKDDLHACHLLNEQHKTTIDGLNKQLAAKDETITNLTGQTKYLQEAFDKAQATLEEMMGKGPGKTVVLTQALPQPLHDKLKALADAHPDLIEYDAAKGAVRWKADLLFDLGSDQLGGSAEALDSLKEFAAIVTSEAATGFDVIVVGHTCTTPIRRPETLAQHKTNWHLSAHRAISVMNLLAGQNVAMTRMGVMGYGEHRPMADNASKEGKAKNRRVEIYLVARDAVRSVSRGVRRVDGTDLAFLPASGR